MGTVQAAVAKADAGCASWTQTTVLLAASGLTYKSVGDLERVLDGLRKAGVPELPFDYDRKAADRLSGEEIRLLLFGHTTRGRDAECSAFSVTRTAAGTFTFIGASGSETGRTVIEGDRMCNFHPRTSGP